MSAVLQTASGDLTLPAFLPDGTLGVVRSVDAQDLERAGVQALVMNVFHLMQRPGSSTIQALGGLHRMSGWKGPIITDSGGFQAYSLIRQNPRFGRLTDAGIRFRPENADRDFQLTPEKCVQLQIAYGANVVICLDDCTHVDEGLEEQRAAVRRTIAWARRCKAEFDRQVEQRRKKADTGEWADTGLRPYRRPLLFGVVQGGHDPALRRECAEALLELNLDGFGYGGWPLDAQGHLLYDILALTRSLIPASLPMHALGVGQPANVVACAALGYQMFDSALPTRDARDGRLYAFTGDPAGPGFALQGEWYTTVYVHDKKHIKANVPVYPSCDCYTCRTYSLGYLHHLHKVNDTLYFRLATIHNLRFMARLMTAISTD